MRKIIERLFGRKYYLNVVNDMRTDFVNSTPFATREQADNHRRGLMGRAGLSYVCTITFRTHETLELNG